MFHKRTIDKRRRFVLVVAFGVVAVVVCYFIAVFVRLVAVAVVRGGALVGDFSIRGHLPTQSLRKKYFRLGLTRGCGGGDLLQEMWFWAIMWWGVLDILVLFWYNCGEQTRVA